MTRAPVIATESGATVAAGLGALAGLILLAAEVLVSALSGAGFATPLRYAASVVAGQDALERTGPFVISGGLVVHLFISAGWGCVFGAIQRALPPTTQVAPRRQALIGLAFGAAVWAIDLQMIAGALCPWFLDVPQAAQLALHAALFGAPLGVLFAAAASRGPLRPVVEPARG
jgi:hypothetical protein